VKVTEDTGEYKETVDTKHKLGYTGCFTGSTILSGLGLGSIDIFYLKFYGLDPRLMALSWILFAAWNAINDPLIGIIEDKTKSSIGRRIPYLRYGALPYFLSFLLVWFPFILVSNFGLSFMQERYPGIDSTDMGLFWNHLIMLFIFDTLFSMIGLIMNNLPAEMAVTSKARSDIVLFASIVGLVGIILPILLPTLLLGGDNPSKVTFLIVMVVIGVLAGLMLFVGCYFIKENRYTVTEEPLGFIESIKETFKNKPFMILEITIFALALMQEIMFSGFIFLMDYVIIYNGWISILAVIPVVLMVIFALFWANKNIPKYGIKKIMIFGAIIGIIGFLLLLVIGLASPNSKVSVESSIIALGFLAIGLILYIINLQPIQAEAVDYDEIQTGKRRETTYSGVNALLTKPAISIAHFITLNIMALYGYNEDLKVSEQPASVSLGVLIAFTVVPIICLFIGIVALYYFPLDGEKWNKQKALLQKIHIKKEKEYLESLMKEGKIEKNNT
jgi:glycoside/pentoside/hexuronide:cation symporter, GPH family